MLVNNLLEVGSQELVTILKQQVIMHYCLATTTRVGTSNSSS
jgi:hypothetical protein